ncbi:VOC family protein [Aliiroseovarius sp. 2305UL8-7]|uniref:VOC family protein n=1 Tax=Aliiroseovarius conchicola TaxID=3121637 RepID=UPI003528F77D
MPKLDRLTLRTADPARLTEFYRDILGMRELGPSHFTYSDAEMSVFFEQAQTGDYTPAADDLYWKIAISVPDLDLAYDQLRAKGVDVPPPRQFRDVGYLTNFTDPDGFGIELIQHGFQGETSPVPTDPSLLGGGPCLNLLTLRHHDIASVERLCADQLGMRPLSVQPVEPYGFTLYFYAFTDEVPPDHDLTAIANRGWTYRRPYTVLEVQHVHAGHAIQHADPSKPGYFGANVKGVAIPSGNPLGLFGGE